MDNVEILLQMSYEEWAQARHLEDQRATITNMVLLIVFVALGFISEKGLSTDILPVTIALIALGIFGALASEKLYERNQFHIQRARFLRRKVYELRAEAKIDEVRSKAREVHNKEFPRLSKIRLHHVWLVLHIAISLIGIILTIWSLFV